MAERGRIPNRVPPPCCPAAPRRSTLGRAGVAHPSLRWVFSPFSPCLPHTQVFPASYGRSHALVQPSWAKSLVWKTSYIVN